ncbi:hypothetical protein FS842_008378 [Serendipita sp. 407]|nr:hypothetical protein FS842_008378 [Serendipita sp. 407]
MLDLLLKQPVFRTLVSQKPKPSYTRLFIQTLSPPVARMSTKTIAVLNESELADGQMKEVAFGEGKVLVARLGEKVVSTSAYCTHYGAPLAKGVLTADGRITCPWHGACFNACTGDIEDAPALFGIHSFQTSVEDGQICVTADPKYTKKDDNLVRQPGFAAADFNKEESSGVVIVGGGSGAMHAIESLRDNGYKDSITVLSKEDYPPIDRTKLSKSLATQVSKVQLHSAEELRDKYGVDLRTGVTVTFVNTASMTVQAQPQGGSEETIPYTNLILAPGSFPRRLPIPNANLSNIYTLRFLEDSQKIDAACQKDLRVVIIGTSFISMELATTIAKRGMKSVDMVGMENTPFETIMGKEFVAYYFKENKVVALASMGRDPIMSKSSELMRLGIMPTAQEIKDGADVLQVDVSSVQALQRIAALKQ